MGSGIRVIRAIKNITPPPISFFNIINSVRACIVKNFEERKQIAARAQCVRFFFVPAIFQVKIRMAFPSRENGIRISFCNLAKRYGDTRDFAIVHTNPRNYEALARDVRMQRTVSAVWSQMANFLVSDDARVQHDLPLVVHVATGRFRTAYTTLTRVESLADVARGSL